MGDPVADHGIARKLFGSPSPVLRTRTTTLFREEEEEEEDPVVNLFSNGGSQAERRFYYRFISAGGKPRNLFGSLRTRSDGQNLNGSASMVGLQKTTPLPSGGQGRARFPIYYPSTPLHEIQRRRNRLRELLISLWNDISLLESPNPKKLLNAIDVVEKVVMKEICRIQSTPSAKEAERKRKALPDIGERVSKLERKLIHVKDMVRTLRRSY